MYLLNIRDVEYFVKNNHNSLESHYIYFFHSNHIPSVLCRRKIQARVQMVAAPGGDGPGLLAADNPVPGGRPLLQGPEGGRSGPRGHMASLQPLQATRGLEICHLYVCTFKVSVFRNIFFYEKVNGSCRKTRVYSVPNK